MSTKGLKVGDIVEYNNSGLKFTAKVLEISSTQKAVIQALKDVDETFNTKTKVNTYRRNMRIVEKSKKDNKYGSVWSLVSTSKDDEFEPYVDATVFLDKNATLKDAAKALRTNIDDFFNGRVEKDVPTDFIELMKFIKDFNDRSLSLYIKRIYPTDKNSS